MYEKKTKKNWKKCMGEKKYGKKIYDEKNEKSTKNKSTGE
jgi:hypothetical protein